MFGQVTDRTITPREILNDPNHVQYMKARVMSAAHSVYGGATFPYEILAGTFVSELTATGEICPTKRTTVESGGGAGATTCVLVNSTAFQAGDEISIGADTGITILTINHTTRAITFAATTIANGEAVVGSGTTLAGSATTIGILNEFVDLYDRTTQAPVDRTVSTVLVHGEVLNSMLLGDKAAIRAADLAGANNLRLIRVV